MPDTDASQTIAWTFPHAKGAGGAQFSTNPVPIFLLPPYTPAGSHEQGLEERMSYFPLGWMIEGLESRSYLSISFSAPVEIGGIQPPGGIVVGEVNKDGISDVVVAGSSATAPQALLD